MNKPSSTITAATIAGMSMSVMWEVLMTFSTIEPSAGLISGSTALAAAIVGYKTKERVLS